MLYKNTTTGIVYPFAEPIDDEKIELFFNSAKDMRVVCNKIDVVEEDREFEDFEYFYYMDQHVHLFDNEKKVDGKKSFISKILRLFGI